MLFAVFPLKKYLYKPYTKLINAWIAGVPIIVGNESAYHAIQKSEFDFLMAQEKSELIEALKKLKQDKDFRFKMVQNGINRGLDFTEEIIIQTWVRFLYEEVPVFYEKWLRKGGFGRKLFYTDLFVSRTFRSLKKRVLNWL